MNISNVNKLRGIIELLLENESRANESKPIRYWYPLSLATYDTDEIIEALDSMCSFRTSMAEKTLNFERKFSQFQNCTDSVMVNSGSSADFLACLLLTNPLKPYLKKGAEIIIPVLTWPTHIWSAMMAGLKVRLVDADPFTLNIDSEDLERSVNADTGAVFIVHVMGNPCNMDFISNICDDNKLILLEDCCESMGSKWKEKNVGNFGLASSFSFFFSHHITTMEGGMICLNDQEDAEHLKIMRSHGWLRDVSQSLINNFSLNENVDPRYSFINWGMNVRPTEIQAGFGIRQLEKYPFYYKKRDDYFNIFNNYISSLNGLMYTPRVHMNATPSWFALPIMIDEKAPFTRNEITNYLELHGIETRPIIAGNLCNHFVSKVFPEINNRQFNGAQKVHEQGFYIGLSPVQPLYNIEKAVNILQDFIKKKA